MLIGDFNIIFCIIGSIQDSFIIIILKFRKIDDPYRQCAGPGTFSRIRKSKINKFVGSQVPVPVYLGNNLQYRYQLLIKIR